MRARGSYARSTACLRKIVELDGESTEMLDALASAHGLLGELELHAGDLNAARTQFEVSITYRQRFLVETGGAPAFFAALAARLASASTDTHELNHWAVEWRRFEASVLIADRKHLLVESMAQDFSGISVESLLDEPLEQAIPPPKTWPERRAYFTDRLAAELSVLDTPAAKMEDILAAAESYRELGRAELAMGQRCVSLKHFEQAIVACCCLLDLEGTSVGSSGLLSLACWDAGEVHASIGAQQTARTCYHESVSAWREMLTLTGWGGDELVGATVLAKRLASLGAFEQKLGNHEQTVKHLEESVAVRREVNRRVGGTPSSRRALAQGLQLLGEAELAHDREGRALLAHAESLELWERLLAEAGPTPQALEDLASSQHDVALALVENRQSKIALERFRQNIDTLGQQVDIQNDRADTLEAVLTGLEWIWALERSHGNTAHAERALADHKDQRRRLMAAKQQRSGLWLWALTWVRRWGKVFILETAGMRPG